jgi:hypothetical protein
MGIRWAILLLLPACSNAFGWGDQGREVVALVANHVLDPDSLQEDR